VYISSIDQIKNSPYGVTKRISEIIVQNICKDYLILRPSSLVGNEMRKNSFQKIVNGEDIELTPCTVMNYILYEDVLNSIIENYSGVKVLRSSENITLKEVAEIFKKKISFGKIRYDAGDIMTDIDTAKTSRDNLLLYKEIISAKG
jgi:nucleoside-diphosphate-sugar epimerase